MSKNKLYKFYGILLTDILTLMDANKKDLHATLKKSHGIESLTKLSFKELYDYIISIQAHFASEYGIELPLRDNHMTLSEYLKEVNNE